MGANQTCTSTDLCVCVCVRTCLLHAVICSWSQTSMLYCACSRLRCSKPARLSSHTNPVLFQPLDTPCVVFTSCHQLPLTNCSCTVSPTSCYWWILLASVRLAPQSTTTATRQRRRLRTTSSAHTHCHGQPNQAAAVLLQLQLKKVKDSSENKKPFWLITLLKTKKKHYFKKSPRDEWIMMMMWLELFECY